MKEPPNLRSLLALLLFLGVLPSFAEASSSYRRLKLYEIAVQAEVIVTGEITKLRSETFDFSVDEIVVGDSVPGSLRVKRFESWTCHGRWAGYQVGQRLMLYLRADEKNSGRFLILGAGDEGEMPFLGTDVIMDDAHNTWVQGFEVEAHKVLGGEITGSKMPYSELRAAILGFREACKWEMRGRVLRVSPRESLDALRTFSSTSKVARHLVESARTSSHWVGPRPEPDVLLERSDLRALGISERASSGPFSVAPDRKLARDEFKLRARSQYLVAFLGDVDGDGIGDLALGEPTDSRLGNRHGTLWILFLDGNGDVRGRTEIGEQLAGFSATMNEFAALGKSVVGLGDLNGDGTPDLAVGAPGWDSDSDKRGGVWVLFLKRDGSVQRAVELGSTSLMKAVGVGADFGLGESLANLGDLDGDGSLELAIGQDPAFDYGWEHGRSILIASLDSQAAVKRVRRIHARDDGFADRYSWFGDSITAVGDVDGDGTSDLAISDPSSDDGGNSRGAVWIVFLGPDLTIKGKQKISDWHGGFEGQLLEGASFGSSLTRPGDLDGDGTPDLLVGSTGRLWTLFLKKNGTVRSHQEATLAKQRDENGFNFGTAVAVTPSSSRAANQGLLVLGGSWSAGKSLWWLELSPDGRIRGR